MKKEVVFIIIFSLVSLLLGGFIGIKLFSYNQSDIVCQCDCSEASKVITYPEVNYFEHIRLNDTFKIISSKDELNSYLNSITENNIKNAEDIGNIRLKYENLDFSTNQLLFLRISNSGCDRYIFNIEKINLTSPTITIELSKLEKNDLETCNAYFTTVYTLVIQKGNYTNVEISR